MKISLKSKAKKRNRKEEEEDSKLAKVSLRNLTKAYKNPLLFIFQCNL